MNTLNAFGAAFVVVIPVEVKQEAFDAVSHLMTTLLKVTGGRSTIRPYGLPTFMNRTNSDLEEAKVRKSLRETATDLRRVLSG
jgi:cellulose biosynthesis protein BcsQ